MLRRRTHCATLTSQPTCVDANSVTMARTGRMSAQAARTCLYILAYIQQAKPVLLPPPHATAALAPPHGRCWQPTSPGHPPGAARARHSTCCCSRRSLFDVPTPALHHARPRTCVHALVLLPDCMTSSVRHTPHGYPAKLPEHNRISRITSTGAPCTRTCWSATRPCAPAPEEPGAIVCAATPDCS